MTSLCDTEARSTGQIARGYEPAEIDQFQVEDEPDVLPADPAVRARYAQALAAEATIYGLPSVYQYAQMVVQAVDTSSPTYTGFDVWDHQRDVATPTFDAFKTPNVDTLYSNAWLDLTDGPALIRVPPIRARYYTLHFLDAFSNSTNLSSRTVGPEGGLFLVTPPGWVGTVPAAATQFRVASPYMWILMRILVGPAPGDVSRGPRAPAGGRDHALGRRRPGRLRAYAPGVGRDGLPELLRGARLLAAGEPADRCTRTRMSTVSGASVWAAPRRSTSMRSTTRVRRGLEAGFAQGMETDPVDAVRIRDAVGRYGMDQRNGRRGRLQLPPPRDPQLHRDRREPARGEGLLRGPRDCGR